MKTMESQLRQRCSHLHTPSRECGGDGDAMGRDNTTVAQVQSKHTRTLYSMLARAIKAVARAGDCATQIKPAVANILIR